jgi:hypothetical protein
MRYVVAINAAFCVGLWALTGSEWFAIPISLSLGGLLIISKER